MTQFVHHDRGGRRGPYTAVHAEGPWYCMVPEGLDVPPGSMLLRSGGVMFAKAVVDEHLETLRRVGWASERSLRMGVRDGVGWEQV